MAYLYTINAEMTARLFALLFVVVGSIVIPPLYSWGSGKNISMMTVFYIILGVVLISLLFYVCFEYVIQLWPMLFLT